MWKKDDSGAWNQDALMQGRAGLAQCGYALDISGSKLAIGCPGRYLQWDDGSEGYDGPLVKVCDSAGNWTCVNIEQDREAYMSEFGRSVALNGDGTLVASGAPRGRSWGGDNAAYVGGWAAVFNLEETDVHGGPKQVGPRIVSDRSLLNKQAKLRLSKWYVDWRAAEAPGRVSNGGRGSTS